MAVISINGITVDPAQQAQELRTAGLEAVDAAESDHILIQTDAPLDPSQKAALADLGVQIREYVSENTYLADYPGTDLTRIRDLDFVTWADVYLRVFKIAPALLPDGTGRSDVRALAELAPGVDGRDEQVELLLHPGVDPTPELVSDVAQAAGVPADEVVVTPHKLRLPTTSGRLPDLARFDEIREIHPIPKRTLFNNVARGILDATVVINGTNYDGDGELVAVADTGFDKGDTTDVHPAFTGRVEKLYALGRPGLTDDPNGHGTHVAGSVLGDGNSPTMGGAIQGTAPAAHLILQSLLDSSDGLGGIPADLHQLFQPTYDDGARVHTNSWGPVTPSVAYDASCREIDDFVWTHPDQVILYAAGNHGVDRDKDGVIDEKLVGGEGAAKNCITVGASESLRPDIEITYGSWNSSAWPVAPINPDLWANNKDGMAAFSDRGPTQEGRIKPDVVAPGTSILSTLSRNAPMSSDFGTSTDPLYFFEAGTSMATPLVAGCAAVLRQTLVKNGNPTPSAALVKALLINGAVELPGQYSPTEAGASPNNASGWGRVDLAGSVIIPGPNADAGFGEGGPLKQGEEDSFPITIGEGHQHKKAADVAPAALGSSLKITLVWTDPPGPQLQNDLDLIVIAADGAERHGNCGTSKNFDRSNNVEQVVWDNMPAGEARIVIRAFRITQFPQPYAYAWRTH
ncbi:Subtilase family protein [Nakamurella panacisegetis]|uniref:Subtilase family protein n=1 Tax=Nakamurella panacisegetis TaxID=1090615 RepID=A0A1H0KB10_9ACTN|nr:S8 family serine peptidase [Nakamurella panacisegetis]SDO53125.1 Subtilase family protein [Nakamurella panacisegetis]